MEYLLKVRGVARRCLACGRAHCAAGFCLPFTRGNVAMCPPQLSLRSSRVSDVQVWSVANPHTTVPYERRTAGKLRLDSWVSVDDLGEGNTVETVCRTGFKFPTSGEGKTFVTGNIDLDHADAGSTLLQGRHASSRGPTGVNPLVACLRPPVLAV